MTRGPLRLPLCDHVQLLVHDDNNLELLLRTEATNRQITLPITGTLALSLRGILAMHFDTSNWPEE